MKYRDSMDFGDFDLVKSLDISSIHMRDRQNERTRKWNSVRGFAFGVPALLCKAFDDFV